LKNGKAAGVDEVQPELLKYGEAAVPYFTRLCNQIWGLTQFRLNGEMLSLFHCLKRRFIRMRQLAWNNIAVGAREIFASVVLDRIKKAVDNTLRQEQAGFRPGRSCNDEIFTLRHY